jgi:hypothetical protein
MTRTENADAAVAPRAVAYIRVSMAREGMISPELQMAAISEHCKRRGYRIVEVLEDLDLSGRFWRRRQVDAAICMLEDGEAEAIVVWRWSRVARNRLDWAVAVDRVEAAGGTLESATEPFDVSTSTGRFARGMLAEFAAYESDRLGDVWREVRAHRLSLGVPVNGMPQFGYTKDGGRYVVHRTRGPLLAAPGLRAPQSRMALYCECFGSTWLGARGESLEASCCGLPLGSDDRQLPEGTFDHGVNGPVSLKPLHCGS